MNRLDIGRLRPTIKAANASAGAIRPTPLTGAVSASAA
jgi:hypothetical protein